FDFAHLSSGTLAENFDTDCTCFEHATGTVSTILSLPLHRQGMEDPNVVEIDEEPLMKFTPLLASCTCLLVLGANDGWTQEGLPAPEVETRNSSLSYQPQVGIFWMPDSCKTSGIMAGATLYFLKPYFQNNVAFSTTTGIGTASPTQTNTDFDWNLGLAPAFWLGWASSSGLGVRGRYFNFDHSSGTQVAGLAPGLAASTTIDPAPGLNPQPGGFNFRSPGVVLGGGLGTDALEFSSNLSLMVFDAEATYDWRAGKLAVLLTVGGRYLQLDQSYSAILRNTGAAATELQRLDLDRTFEGGGPTASMQARVDLGWTGLALFGLVRGSMLVGSTRQDSTFNRAVTDPGGLVGGSQNVTARRTGSSSSTLPVAELELGLEYGRTFGRYRPFLRAAVVNQTYFDAGNASGAGGNLSLFGGQLSLGVNY